MKFLFFFFRGLVLLCLLLLCGFIFSIGAYASSSQTASHPPVVILSSIKPMTLVVQALLNAIPQDRVQISTLLEGNVSPHHYSLGIADAAAIQRADLLVWIGEDFERFLSKPVIRRKKTSLAMSELAGLSDTIHGHDQDTDHHDRDMHLWLNPNNMLVLADALTRRLSGLLPSFTSQIAINRAVFEQELQKMQKAIFAHFEAITPASYFVFHDAYGHFTRAFNLPEAIALTQVPEQILSAKQLISLHKKSAAAACLLVELGNHEKGLAYAAKLKVPMVTVDMLAYDAAITHYPQLLWAVADRFGQCWHP